MATNDDKTILDIAKRAIEAGRESEARSLLHPLMKRDVTEAYFLATKVAKNQEQALIFINRAMLLDPDNHRIQTRLLELQKIYDAQNKKTVGEMATDSPTVDSHKIEETVELFEDYGWQVVGRRSGYAQFMRKSGMTASTAFICGLFLNVIGVIFALTIYLLSESRHMFIELDNDSIRLSRMGDEIFIDYPEQSLVFLEKTKVLSLQQALIYVLIGVLISTTILAFIYINIDFSTTAGLYR